MSTPTTTRSPFHGSCHCGSIKYIVFITLPPESAVGPGTTRFYKCNCTICTKIGYLHCRLPDSTQDFLLLSPTKLENLASYQVFKKHIDWVFCRDCGVRCFAVAGPMETVEVDVQELVEGKSEGKKTLVTRPQAGAWVERGTREQRNAYLSVNLLTLEKEQGFDLRELVEKKWLAYLDCYETGGVRSEPRYDRPFEEGTY
jgi:hypothetical protein